MLFRSHESANKYHNLNFHLLKGPRFGNATDFRWYGKCQTIISHGPGQSKMSVQLSQVCTLMRIESQFFRHLIPSSWSWGGHFHTFGLILSSLFVGKICCGQRFEMEHCILKAYHLHVLWTTYEQKGMFKCLWLSRMHKLYFNQFRFIILTKQHYTCISTCQFIFKGTGKEMLERKCFALQM